MGQQTSYLSSVVPDLGKPKLVPKDHGLPTVLRDVSRLATALTAYEFEKNYVPNLMCTSAKLPYKLIVPDRTEDEMTKILNTIKNSQDKMQIECCADKFITGTLWTQEVEPCCEIDPCCVCKPVYHKIDFMRKVETLMRTLRALDERFRREPREKGCICVNKQVAPLELTLLYLKMTILVEIEQLLLMSVAVVVDEQPKGTNSIEEINRFYKQVDTNNRFLRDRISNTLVDISGFQSERVFIPENNNFSQQYDVSHIKNDLQAGLLNNYSLLSGGKVTYIPLHMKEVMRKLTEALSVVESRARVKTVESVTKKHESGKLFDQFGFQLFVNETSLFLCFAKAALVARDIYALPNVAGVAVSHQLRTTKDGVDIKDAESMKGRLEEVDGAQRGRTRLWVDFNMAISFNIPGGGSAVCEIQIVPVQTFIVDATLEGHKLYDEASSKTSTPVKPAKAVPVANPMQR